MGNSVTATLSWAIFANYGACSHYTMHALLAFHTFMLVLLPYTMAQISYCMAAHATLCENYTAWIHP